MIRGDGSITAAGWLAGPYVMMMIPSTCPTRNKRTEVFLFSLSQRHRSINLPFIFNDNTFTKIHICIIIAIKNHKIK
jgi:hypothetical protein